MTKLTVTEHISVVTFGSIPSDKENEMLLNIFRSAAERNICIDMISKTYVITDYTAVAFTVPDEDIPSLINAIASLKLKRAPMISCGHVKLIIKGEEMDCGTGYAFRFMSAIKSAQATPLLITTAVDEISAVVRHSESVSAEEMLRKEFGIK